MKKTLDEIKGEFPQLNEQTKAAVKGGSGSVYSGMDGQAFDLIAYDGYILVTTNHVMMTTTEGNPEEQWITTFNYWDGHEVQADNVEVWDYLYLNSVIVRDFGTHDEGYIYGAYAKPWYMITDMNNQDPYDPNNGYFDDLNITDDPFAYGPDGYNAFGLNADGFDRYGINANTGTPYDGSGFDQYGLSADGYNQQQYASGGGFVNGFDPNGYSMANPNLKEGDFIAAGGYIGGFNQYGKSAAGYTSWDYTLNGGYIGGFDQYGLSAAGYTAQDYWNSGGYIDGFNEYGVSITGHGIEEYEENGGYIEGFNEYGVSADGHTMEEYAENDGYVDGLDQYGCSESENNVIKLNNALSMGLISGLSINDDDSNNNSGTTDQTIIDPPGVNINGSEKQAAFVELQKSVSGQLALSMYQNGHLSYSIIAGVTLNEDAQKLMNAIDDPLIAVSIGTTNGSKASNGHILQGGAFMGNAAPVNPGDPFQAYQEINPSFLSKADIYYNKPGASTLHEVVEAYIGAQISIGSGLTAGYGNGPDRIYQTAHELAPKQSGIITMTVYDSVGNILDFPFIGAARVEWSVNSGSDPAFKKIIQTIP